MADDTRNVVWNLLANFSKARKEAQQTAQSLRDLTEAEKQSNASSVTGNKAATDAETKRTKAVGALGDEIKQFTKEEADAFATTQKNTSAQKEAQKAESGRVGSLKSIVGLLVQSAAAAGNATKGHNNYATAAQRAAAADKVLQRARISEQAASVGSARAANQLETAMSRLDKVYANHKSTTSDAAKAETALQTAHLAVARSANALETATSDVEKAMQSAAGGGGDFNNTLKGLKGSFSDVAGGAQAFLKVMSLMSFGAIAASIGPLVNLISALSAGFVGLVGAITPALGILGTLPALFAGAAVGVGALLLGFGGVASTLKAYTAQQKAAATQTTKAASAQQTAAQKAAAAASAQRTAQIQAINDAKSLRDAEQSVADARQSQSNQEIDSARKIQSAQLALSSARRNAADQEIQDAESVASAQRALTAAEQDATDAEKAMGDARKAAKQNIIDLQNQLKSLRLQEEGSSLSLEAAQAAYRRSLNDPNSSDLDRRQAAFDVQSAQEGVSDAHKATTQTQSQLTDAQKKGIDSSDAVVQAKQAEAAANEKVQESEESLADAKRKSAEDQLEAQQSILKAQQDLSDTQRTAAQDQIKAARDVTNAVENLSDTQKTQALQAKNTAQSLKDAAQAAKDAGASMNQASPQADAYAAALAKLTPAGRAFVKQLISMKPLLDKLKATAQNGILPGASKGLTSIATLFPIINKGLGQASKAIGGDLEKAGKSLSSGPWKRDLPKLFTSNAKLTSLFGDALIAIANILRSVATAAIPLTEWLAKTVTLWLQNKAAAAEAAEQNGKMAKFFGQTKDVLKTLAAIFKNVGTALYNTGKQGADFGRDLLNSLKNLTGRWSDWTKSIEGQNSLKKWYDDARPILTETGKLVGAIAEGFSGLGSSQGTVTFIRQLRTQLGPAVEQLLHDLSGGPVGGQIISFFTTVINLLDTLVSNGGGSFGLLITSLTDFLKIVNDIINVVPGGTSTLGAFLTTIAIFKVAKILSMVSGISSLVRIIKEYKKASVGIEGASGIGAAIAGGSGKGGAAGGIGSAISGLFGVGGLKSQTTTEMEGVAEEIDKGAKGPVTRALRGLGGVIAGSVGFLTKPLSGIGKAIGGTFTSTVPKAAKPIEDIGKKAIVSGGFLSRFGGIMAALGPETLGVSLAVGALGIGVYELGESSKKDAIPSFNDLYGAMVKQYDATGNNVKGYQNLQTAVANAGAKFKTTVANDSQLRSSYGATTQEVQRLTNEIATNSQDAAQAGAKYKDLQAQLGTLTGNADKLGLSLGLSRGQALSFADSLGLNLSSNSAKADKAINNTITNVDAIRTQFDVTTPQAAALAKKLGVDLAGNLDKVGKNGKTGRQILDDYATSLKNSDDPATKMANNLETIYNNSSSADDKMAALNSQIGVFSGDALSASQASDDFYSALNSMTTTLKTNHGALTGNTQGAIDNREAILNGVTAAQRHATAVYKQTGNINLAKKALVDDESALEANAAKTTGNKKEVDKLLGSVGGLPHQADVALSHMKTMGDGTKTNLDKNFKKPWVVNVGLQVKNDPSFVGGSTKAKADGGYISGPGGPRSDSIPARLSNGEYVVNAAATRTYRPVLERINRTKGQRGFANGGYVSRFADGGMVTVPPVPTNPVISLEDHVPTADSLVKTVLSDVATAAQDLGKSFEDTIDSFTGGSILNYAKNFIGIPYVWGGSDPHGFDCSGLTSYVLHHLGINAPRTAAQQQDWAIPESKAQALPGDLVFWGDPAHHVAFFMGGSKILEAPHTGELVKIANLYDHPTFGREKGLKTGDQGGKSVGGAPSATSGAAQAYAKSLLPSFGWGMDQWNSLKALWQGESGWNSNAQNPVSTAYGIAQFLNSTWGPYGPKTSNYRSQVYYGEEYIRDSYRNPNNAYSKWSGRSPHWYATGGAVPGFGTKDTVPAMLTPGEFVINRKAVNRIGVSRLHAMNETPTSARQGQTGMQYFHTGGFVNGFKPNAHGPYIRALRWEEGLPNWNFQGWDRDLTTALKKKFPRPLKTIPQIDVSRLISWLDHTAGNTAGGKKTNFGDIAAHFSHYKQMSPVQVIEAASAAQGQANNAQAAALRKASDFSAAQFAKLDQLQRVAERDPRNQKAAQAVRNQQKIASRASAAHNAVSHRQTTTSNWERLPKTTRDTFMAGVKSASDIYHADIRSLQHHASLTQNGKWTTGMNGPVDHIIDHGLGIKHDKWAPRPWNPLTAAEQAEEDQERANKLQAEFDGYLETFAIWGLKDLVAKLMDLGVADGMDIARSASKNKTVATNLNAAYAAANAIDPDTQKDMLNLIAQLANSTTPVGIRAVATNLQIPDYAVIDLWDKIADEVKKKIPSNKLTKLQSDIDSFRKGTFYAADGGQVPGTGNSDSQPAMLTPGEFVLRKNVAKFFGIDTLRAMNTAPQYFAMGGPVMPAMAASMSGVGLPRSANGAVAPVVNYNFDTVINNPTGENSVASMNKNLRRKAALGALPGGN